MRKIIIKMINAYQKGISPFLELLFGKGCRFYPTCSSYSKESMEKFGITKGAILSFKRLLRCNPFNQGGIDLVSEKT